MLHNSVPNKISKKNVWKACLLLYVIFIFSMRREEYIFLNTVPENVWFPIFNIISIGLLVVSFRRIFQKSRSKQTEGIIIFCIIFISMLSFSYDYVFNQSEYYRLKSTALPKSIMVGIEYQKPNSGRNQITFYEKSGYFSYRKVTVSDLTDISSVSKDLKSNDYYIDKETQKIFFENGDQYYIYY